MTQTAAADGIRMEIDSARLIRELEELAGFTSVAQPAQGRAVTRVVFSENDLRARAWLKGLAAAEGLTIREDAVGNTFFRWEGADPALPAVATGSHIDAIPHAGMYDGTVGVLGGLEAIRALKRSGLRPRRSVELVLLTSEEPTRFGIGCLGSRLLAGVLEPERADAMHGTQRGHEADTVATVRTAAGFAGPLSGVRLPKGHYHAWVELHIEQGPILEREGLAIGIVSAIAAPASYRMTVEGFGGHAGALLMPDRIDALCAAAEIILAVEANALATNSVDTVATVGTCDVYPGAVNSVPSRVVLDLDVRDVDAKRRERVMDGLRADVERISNKRDAKIRETLINEDEPATCSAEIVRAIEEVCREMKLASRRMVSRAYHDSLFMAQIAPMGMIFIPCRGGVSHKPDEYASPEDMANGTRVLAGTLARLAME